MLEIIDLDKSFPATDDLEEAIIFTGLAALIWHGRRVGLVGQRRGEVLTIPHHLRTRRGQRGGDCSSVQVGYYAEEHETLEYAWP